MDLHRSRPTGRHLRTHDPENGQRWQPLPLLVGHRLDKEGTTSELSRGTSDLESRGDVADMPRQVPFSGESSEARLRRNRRRGRTCQRRSGLLRRADRPARSPPRRSPRPERSPGRCRVSQHQGLLDLVASASPGPRSSGSRGGSAGLAREAIDNMPRPRRIGSPTSAPGRAHRRPHRIPAARPSDPVPSGTYGLRPRGDHATVRWRSGQSPGE